MYDLFVGNPSDLVVRIIAAEAGSLLRDSDRQRLLFALPPHLHWAPGGHQAGPPARGPDRHHGEPGGDHRPWSPRHLLRLQLMFRLSVW